MNDPALAALRLARQHFDEGGEARKVEAPVQREEQPQSGGGGGGGDYVTIIDPSDHRSVVGQAFRDVLGREADQGGLDFFSDQVSQGKLGVDDLYSQLYNSPEFMNTLRLQGYNSNEQNTSAPTGNAPTTNTPLYMQSFDFGKYGNTAEAAHAYYSQFFPEHTVNGILGNAAQESYLDPTMKQIGGGPGRGLFQWEEGDGGRWSNNWNNPNKMGVQEFAKQNGFDPMSAEAQMRFSIYEMTQNPEYRGLFNSLQNAKDSRQATDLFHDKYERAGKSNMDARYDFADMFADAAKNNWDTSKLAENYTDYDRYFSNPVGNSAAQIPYREPGTAISTQPTTEIANNFTPNEGRNGVQNFVPDEDSSSMIQTAGTGTPASDPGFGARDVPADLFTGDIFGTGPGNSFVERGPTAPTIAPSTFTDVSNPNIQTNSTGITGTTILPWDTGLNITNSNFGTSSNGIPFDFGTSAINPGFTTGIGNVSPGLISFDFNQFNQGGAVDNAVRTARAMGGMVYQEPMTGERPIDRMNRMLRAPSKSGKAQDQQSEMFDYLQNYPGPAVRDRTFAEGGAVEEEPDPAAYDEDTYGPRTLAERTDRIQGLSDAVTEGATRERPGDAIEPPQGYLTPSRAVAVRHTDTGAMPVDAEGNELSWIKRPALAPVYKDNGEYRLAMPGLADVLGNVTGAPVGAAVASAANAARMTSAERAAEGAKMRTWVGPKSAAAQDPIVAQALETARNLHAQSVPQDAIQSETNWRLLHPGREGSEGWGFEIPDQLRLTEKDAYTNNPQVWGPDRKFYDYANPALQEAQPALDKVRNAIEINKKLPEYEGTNYTGEYDPNMNWVTARADNMKDLESTVAHEYQHATGDVFSRGADPDSDQLLKHFNKIRAEAMQKVPDLEEKMFKYKAGPEQWKLDNPKAAAELERLDYVWRNIKTPHDLYEHTLGEAVARATGDRLGMSAEERMNAPARFKTSGGKEIPEQYLIPAEKIYGEDMFRGAHKTGGAVNCPSEAQKEAGNYRKHHTSFKGLPISIENLKGSERSGTDPNGKRWSVTMPAHYGYIKGTEGADGDHVDCYIGSDENSDKVFIVDQQDHKSGKFDEHKVMLGYPSIDKAMTAYCRGFSDGKGPQRVQNVIETDIAGFKHWLKNHQMKKPSALTKALDLTSFSPDAARDAVQLAKQHRGRTANS